MHISTHWFDLRENALSLLIFGRDRLKRDREKGRGGEELVVQWHGSEREICRKGELSV